MKLLCRKLNTESPYDEEIPVLGIYSTELEAGTWTLMFTAALFTIAKRWQQPKCLLTGEWMNKMWYTKHGILLSFKKEGNSNNATKLMNFEDIMLIGMSVTEE